jgi:uracil-DNA glycosylase family 4
MPKGAKKKLEILPQNSPTMPFCALCPRLPGRVPIKGSGAVPASVMAIGEAPSRSDDRYRSVFTGKSGGELYEQYFPMAGLQRGEVFLTHIHKCSVSDYTQPEEQNCEVCADKWLHDELATVKPELVIVMGARACSVFPLVEINNHHGLLFHANYGQWSGYIYPTYSPLAGLQSADLMIPLQQDFQNLKNIRANWDSSKLQARTLCKTHYNNYDSDLDYELISSPDQLNYYLEQTSRKQTMPITGIDSEYLIKENTGLQHDKLHCITISTIPKTGRLLKYSDPYYPEYANIINKFINQKDQWLALHQDLADRDIITESGVIVPEYKVIDTMILPYHQAETFQGLKYLAYRKFGYRMLEFEDVVWKYYQDLVMWAMMSMLDFKYPHPKKDKRWKISRTIDSWVEGLALDQTFRVDKKYKEWVEDKPDLEQIRMETSGIRMPLPLVDMVPDWHLVKYACADSDITLRLALEMGMFGWTDREWYPVNLGKHMLEI